tara:strand:- start:323 stop:751 length:429 start_codon:yes stop_codon:yes gene_type:complete
MAYKTIYKPKNKSKYVGNVDNIVCRSLWERRFCKYLDENKNILRWGSEELAIPYISPIDDKIHRYYPDFLMEVINKKGETETLLIEIKPKKQTKAPTSKNKRTKMKELIRYKINFAKWEHAKNYCVEKNWKFLILTEDHLLP